MDDLPPEVAALLADFLPCDSLSSLATTSRGIRGVLVAAGVWCDRCDRPACSGCSKYCCFSQQRPRSNCPELSKVVEPPEKLLSQAGMMLFKKTAFEDLHRYQDQSRFNALVQELRVNNFLVYDSAKVEADLLQGFRLARAVMRQQIKRRLVLDLGKKDKELKTTFSYLGKHLGSLPPVGGMQVVYNAAYVMSKYLNLDNPVAGKHEEDQRMAGKKDIWDVAFKRNKADPVSLQQLKLKVKNALVGGYRPL